MVEDRNNNNSERSNIIPITQGDGPQTLFEYSLPSIFGVAPSIRRPLASVSDFELKPTIIQMVQGAVQFHGLPNEDPNAHIVDFLEICDTFKCNGASENAIRLRLFPFSLKDKAKVWLQSQPSYSIITWEDLAKRFLTRYFPPAKTMRMRSDIINFLQIEDESLYNAWERYKELIRRCPHHGLPTWLIVQTFYNGISPLNRSIVDATSGGIFMKKTPEKAYDLLEDMAAKNYHWQPERQLSKKAKGIHNIDTLITVATKLEMLSNKLDKLTTISVQSQGAVCNLCGGIHITVDCQEGNLFTQGSKSVNYVSNTNWSKGNKQGWRNQLRQALPGFQGFQLHERRPSIEELLSKLVAQNEMRFQNNEVVIKNLEIEVGQITNILFTRLHGTLPSNTETNPREEMNARTTRRGKEVVESSGAIAKEVKPYQPHIPFPKRLKQQHLDKQFAKFLEIFEKLHVNIPFLETLAQMPSYVKFLNEILSNKQKLDELEIVDLNEECSAILQKKLPQKLKDPGTFNISCTIGSTKFEKALCDSGSSINLMPYSIFRKLGLGEPKPTRVTLQLADRSVRYPRGIVEDVLVKVGKFIFPVDFIILDIEEDEGGPLILGRPFLATCDATINIRLGTLTLKVGDDSQEFNVFNAQTKPPKGDTCYMVANLV